MRKLLVPLFFSIFLFAGAAFAIDLPQGSKPGFSEPATAYSSTSFDRIMKAYGLTLGMESKAPNSYVKFSGNTPELNEVPIAYDPKGYHDILTAYGLQLTPEDAQKKLWVSSYVKVEGGKLVFDKISIAYGGKEWANILEAYSLAKAAPAPVETSAVADDDGDGVPNDRDACPGTPPHAAVDERGCWALSSSVLFDFDKSVIKKEFKYMLDDTKKVFDSSPEMRVQVEGHADSTGPERYNQSLSERRARAVVKYLVQKVGIAPERLTSVGFGEAKPAYPNKTREGRSKNRRVEFTPAP